MATAKLEFIGVVTEKKEHVQEDGTVFARNLIDTHSWSAQLSAGVGAQGNAKGNAAFVLEESNVLQLPLRSRVRITVEVLPTLPASDVRETVVRKAETILKSELEESRDCCGHCQEECRKC